MPSKNGLITSAWLNVEMNPDLPREVWAENSEKIVGRAETLAKQAGSIPVFVKDRKGDDLFQFIGRYRCVDIWTKRAHTEEIEQRNRRVKRDIGALFFLEREGAVPEAAVAKRLIAL